MKVVAGATPRLAKLALCAWSAAILLVAGALDLPFAQTGPFGAPRPQSAPPPAAGGVLGWIFAKQAEFYRALSGAIRAAKADGSAAWTLFGISFLYGIFHAAGPGHGKAVISSYLVANEETWRRGVVLSFASALLQALVAVAIVGIAAVLLNATARDHETRGRRDRDRELCAHHPDRPAAAVGEGARLHHDAADAPPPGRGRRRGHAGAPARSWPSRTSMRAWTRSSAITASQPITITRITSMHHAHGHAHHDHDHDEHASAWGHAHAPEPQELAGPGGWQRGLSAIVAVGLRPCSGAILVLVFSLAQGLFWAGVVSTFIMGLGTAITVAAIATIAVGAKAWAGRFAATRSGYGMLAMRGIEVGAAVVIIAFGALLLTGYMVSERLIGRS